MMIQIFLANYPKLQAQKRLDQVGQLQAEVDAVKAKAKQWKKNMDRLASEKKLPGHNWLLLRFSFGLQRRRTQRRPKRSMNSNLN